LFTYTHLQSYSSSLIPIKLQIIYISSIRTQSFSSHFSITFILLIHFQFYSLLNRSLLNHISSIYHSILQLLSSPSSHFSSLVPLILSLKIHSSSLTSLHTSLFIYPLIDLPSNTLTLSLIYSNPSYLIHHNISLITHPLSLITHPTSLLLYLL
jgi:hypothetical protein